MQLINESTLQSMWGQLAVTFAERDGRAFKRTYVVSHFAELTKTECFFPGYGGEEELG